MLLEGYPPTRGGGREPLPTYPGASQTQAQAERRRRDRERNSSDRGALVTGAPGRASGPQGRSGQGRVQAGAGGRV